MTVKRLLAIALTLLAFGISSAYAVAPSVAGYSVPDIATVKASNLGSKLKITVEGYVETGDGGKADYVLSPTDCGTELPGWCLHDGALPTHNAFKRTDPSPDLRPFGIVQGSAYDINANPTTALDFVPVATAAYTALATVGINSLDTKQVSVIARTILPIPPGGDLGCSTPAPGPRNDGDYHGKPGAIVTSHGAYLYLNDAGESVHNCNGLPEFYVNPSVITDFSGCSFNTPAQNEADLEAYRCNMIQAGDTWLYANNARGAKLHHLAVLGFDDPIHTNKPNELNVRDSDLDGNICLYTENGGSATIFDNVHCEPFLTKNVDDPNNPGSNIQEYESFSVNSCTQSPTTNSWGTHEARLVIGVGIGPNGGHPASDIHSSILNTQGDPVIFPLWITNMQSAGSGGTTGGCLAALGTGPWPNAVISSTSTTVTVDLVNSQYGTGSDKVAFNATWHAGNLPNGCGTTSAQCGILYVTAGDMRSLVVGEIVAGSASLPTGSKIISVVRACNGPDPYDGYIGCVVIDHAPTADASAITALTADGGAYSPTNGSSGNPGCDEVTNNWGCAYEHASERVFSSQTSEAAIDIATLPLSNGRHFGSCLYADDTVGMTWENWQCFNHHFNAALNNTNGCRGLANGSDDTGQVDDTDFVGVLVTNKTNQCSIGGGGALGKVGTSVVMDTANQQDNYGREGVVSNSLGTGLGTITLSSGTFSGWPSDQWGVTTALMCQSFTSSKCPNNLREYLSIAITDSTHATILARGRMNTAPLNLAVSAQIVQTTISSQSNVLSINDIGHVSTDADLVSFELIHGTLLLDKNIVRGGFRTSFISHNAIIANLTNNEMYNLDIFYEDNTALAAMTGSCNIFALVQPWDHCAPNAPFMGMTTIAIPGIYECDASGGDQTFNVNAGSTIPGAEISVVKTDSTTNLCNVVFAVGDTVGGQPSVSIGIPGDVRGFKNDAGTTTWRATQ